MNINLREVICTSKVGLPHDQGMQLVCGLSTLPYSCTQDGDRFWKLPECYIRGNAIKYIRVPNEVRIYLPSCELN
jgi:U6 snRNA-associated Sm-like protein LSm4